MPITVTITVKRVPTLTHEEFIEEWKRFGNLIKSFQVIQENIIRYTQFHPDQSHTDALQKLGMNVIECDGIAELVAESLDDILAVFGDKDILAADEFRLVDRTSLTAVVTEANVVWEKEA